MNKNTFLESFPNHTFRYIDQTGLGRPPLSTAKIDVRKNHEGFESYFTVNGFDSETKATKENLTNINAFFIDIDGRKSIAEIETIKELLEPTYITETMRGYHIYWVLDEPIYKSECFGTQWEEAIVQWENIQTQIVLKLNGDPVVKDITRIMRVPGTYYWKKTGDAYLKGPDSAAFKIKGIHKNLAATYSMDAVSVIFPITEQQRERLENAPYNSAKGLQDFFARVNRIYPIDTRDSYKALIAGEPDEFVKTQGRNQILIVTASLMKQAGLEAMQAYDTIISSGWHGMVNERGGKEEIKNTIASAYKSGYTYSKNHPIIKHYTTDEEEQKIHDAYSLAAKERKERDVVRFQSYEYTLIERHPYVRINEVGMVFIYEDGVYHEAEESWLMNRVLESMEADALFGYKTRNHVKDKIACWVRLMEPLTLTEDPDILNVKNGLLHLKTRTLSEHTPTYVSLYQMPVEYVQDAICPTWIKCLHAWTSGDDEEGKTQVLQQYAGYCLTQSTKHAKMLILVGDGGNGKSTFADTISMLVGKRGTAHISLETLEKNFGPGELLGKRLNIVEEISGNFYHSHILKKIISGEEVTTDKKYFAHFTFKPTAKFIFAVNEMPRVDDSSQATERRMLVVMFNNNFRSNPNTMLRFEDGLLAKELSGILNWSLDGYTSLESIGFVTTEEQARALKEYRDENSSADGFMTECLSPAEGALMEASDLYEKYVIFCKKSGLKPWSRIRLIKYFKMMGIRTRKFSYKERENNHETNKFEGLEFSPIWANLKLDDNGRVVEDGSNGLTLRDF